MGNTLSVCSMCFGMVNVEMLEKNQQLLEAPEDVKSCSLHSPAEMVVSAAMIRDAIPGDVSQSLQSILLFPTATCDSVKPGNYGRSTKEVDPASCNGADQLVEFSSKTDDEQAVSPSESFWRQSNISNSAPDLENSSRQAEVAQSKQQREETENLAFALARASKLALELEACQLELASTKERVRIAEQQAQQAVRRMCLEEWGEDSFLRDITDEDWASDCFYSDEDLSMPTPRCWLATIQEVDESESAQAVCGEEEDVQEEEEAEEQESTQSSVEPRGEKTSGAVLRCKIGPSHGTHEKAEMRNVTMLGEVAPLERQLRAAEACPTMLRAELDVSNERCAVHAGEDAANREKMAAAERECHAIASAIERLKTENAALGAERSELVDKLGNSEQRLLEAVTLAEENLSAKVELQGKVSALSKQREEAERVCVRAIREKGDLTEKVKELGEKLEFVEDEMMVWKAEAEREGAARQEAEQRAEELEETATDLGERVECLASELETAREQDANLREELACLTDQLQNTTATNERERDDFHHFREEAMGWRWALEKERGRGEEAERRAKDLNDEVGMCRQRLHAVLEVERCRAWERAATVLLLSELRGEIEHIVTDVSQTMQVGSQSKEEDAELRVDECAQEREEAGMQAARMVDDSQMDSEILQEEDGAITFVQWLLEEMRAEEHEEEEEDNAQKNLIVRENRQLAMKRTNEQQQTMERTIGSYPVHQWRSGEVDVIDTALDWSPVQEDVGTPPHANDATGWKTLRIKLSDARLLQQGRGKYSVQFSWESGACRLDIVQVSLFACVPGLGPERHETPSACIAVDEHLGSTGLANLRNRYILDLSSPDTWNRAIAAMGEDSASASAESNRCAGHSSSGLWLEGKVRCHGGDDSNGTIFWRKEGNSRPATAIVIGAGQRGTGYSEYALDFPHLLKIVAVADPREGKRRIAQRLHGIDDSGMFTSWEALQTREKIADIAIIATPDRVHAAPATALAKKGYHILLEKPMAVTEEACEAIVREVEAAGVHFAVCHVLRYTPCNRKIKEIIDSGAIGDVVNISHTEPVGFWHFAHSYVRGNWKQEETSSSSLMAKCCHDVDLIRYWMGAPCSRLSSMGSLNHFRPTKQPSAAQGARRCLDCPMQDSCQFSAKTIYLQPAQRGMKHWPVSVLVDGEVEIEAIGAALREGPYGECVYHAGNDVCDNQVVAMEFEGGRTASLTMIAHTESICQRETKVYGSRGELTCRGGEEISVFDFATRTRKSHGPFRPPLQTRVQGHGGADFYLVDAFVAAVASGDASLIRTGPRDALASHLLVFRAEEARKRGSVIPC